MKQCQRCLTAPALSYIDSLGRNYTRRYCIPCRDICDRERIERNRKRPESHEYHRNYKLKTKFGLSADQYDQMVLAQNNVCYICKKEPGFKSLQVDHNHTTGKVRKLLCFKCNTVLGHTGEDISILNNMIEYIKEHA